MQTMQSHVLLALAAWIEECGLTPIDARAMANTGTLYAMDGMEPVWRAAYNFQDGYCTLGGETAFYQGRELEALVTSTKNLIRQAMERRRGAPPEGR